MVKRKNSTRKNYRGGSGAWNNAKSWDANANNSNNNNNDNTPKPPPQPKPPAFTTEQLNFLKESKDKINELSPTDDFLVRSSADELDDRIWEIIQLKIGMWEITKHLRDAICHPEVIRPALDKYYTLINNTPEVPNSAEKEKKLMYLKNYITQIDEKYSTAYIRRFILISNSDWDPQYYYLTRAKDDIEMREQVSRNR